MKRLILQKIISKRRFVNASAKILRPFFIQKKKKGGGVIKNLSLPFEVTDDKKVPKLEVKFLKDQRSERHMAITSTIDKEVSRKLQKREVKKKFADARATAEKKKVTTLSLIPESNYDVDEAGRDLSDKDKDNSKAEKEFVPASSTSKRQPISVTAPVKKRGDIAEATVKNNFSDRAASAIINATLRSYYIPEIIDKSMVRRAVTKKFEEVDKVPTVFGSGLYYDGRKDSILVQKQVDGKFYQSSKTEEHVSLVSLPDGNFRGYVTPENRKAHTISTCILNFLGSKN